MKQKLKDFFSNKELVSAVLFTIFALIIYRIGSNIPVPGINKATLTQIFSGQNMGLMELFNLFTGGSFQNFTVFALGVTPYITASIVVQLLEVAFPYFENLQKEGEEGTKKKNRIMRWMAIGFAVLQGAGITYGLVRQAMSSKTALSFIMIIAILTAGTCFLMWLGDQINEYGIGNGASLIIFAGIISRLPSDFGRIQDALKSKEIQIISAIILAVCAVLIIAWIIAVQQADRKIPVRYGGQAVRSARGALPRKKEYTFIPLKINQAGVIPIIFAISVLQFPQTIALFMQGSKFYNFCMKYLSGTNTGLALWIYLLINAALVIFFNYFYTSITFKPDEIAKNLAQSGGTIMGVRPGKPTEDYLRKSSMGLALWGSIFLVLISTLPYVVSAYTKLNIRFGGTSLLIVTGVAFEVMTQLRSRMTMKKYSGFLSR